MASLTYLILAANLLLTVNQDSTVVTEIDFKPEADALHLKVTEAESNPDAESQFLKAAKSDYHFEANDPSFQQALTSGSVWFSYRMRFEWVELEPLKSAEALTGRIQLGYGTSSYRGFSGYTDFTGVRAIGADRYNAAGLNERPDFAVVADPEVTVLNQLYGQFENDSADLQLRIGRQRIIHQDARFIGNVGWRQNEQTYDAATFRSSLGVDDLNLQYNYLWQVNRIFGPGHDQGVFDSSAHLMLAEYRGFPGQISLSVFYYHLDFDNAPALSSGTAGLRAEGDLPAGERLTLSWKGAFAEQSDAGDNPDSYSASYYKADLALRQGTDWSVGGSYEVLGSDDGQASFKTPLATLHAYQGWADQFLVTPDVGLRDLSFGGSALLISDIRFSARYHSYQSDTGSISFGSEINFSAARPFGEYWSLLVKYARFSAEDAGIDTQKLWLQAQFQF